MPMKSLGKYELLNFLGGGGYGDVYRARNTQTDAIVAIKILKADLSTPLHIEQFRREARLAFPLRHPNIVSVFDFDSDQGYFYIVMDYLEGRPLDQLLTPGQPLPFDQALRILTDIAAGLDYAHKKNVLHRDLKPKNIIILSENDRAVITDFGLARSLDTTPVGSNRSSGFSNINIGTPGFMAPEQILDDAPPLTGAVDCYALGVIAFLLITGHPPFKGQEVDIQYYHAHQNPPDPRKFNPALPPIVKAIFLKSLAKSPTDRYPNASVFISELQSAIMPINKMVSSLPGQEKPPSKTPSNPSLFNKLQSELFEILNLQQLDARKYERAYWILRQWLQNHSESEDEEIVELSIRLFIRTEKHYYSEVNPFIFLDEISRSIPSMAYRIEDALIQKAEGLIANYDDDILWNILIYFKNHPPRRNLDLGRLFLSLSENVISHNIPTSFYFHYQTTSFRKIIWFLQWIDYYDQSLKGKLGQYYQFLAQKIIDGCHDLYDVRRSDLLEIENLLNTAQSYNPSQETKWAVAMICIRLAKKIGGNYDQQIAISRHYLVEAIKLGYDKEARIVASEIGVKITWFDILKGD